jgi:vancomycin resistance protein VanW
LWWHFGGKRFAKPSPNSKRAFPFEHFSHSTPLLRRLKGVDMQLQYNKITNLRIAIDKIHGVVLAPGRTFSFWRLVGRPTRRKGYLPGMVLHHGKVTTGVGGGLCQLTNLLYWMTLHTPLRVTERHRHGYDVFPDAGRTQPFGSGATCFYNYGDLMVENPTDTLFFLNLHLTETKLHGAWLGKTPPEYRYEAYERNHIMQSSGFGGYTRHNQIFRRQFSMDGTLCADEFITENHAIMMYNPMLEGK